MGGYENVDKRDAAQNIAASTRYLGYLISKNSGNLAKALAHYGPHAAYANSIIRAAEALKTSCDPVVTLIGHFGK
jgi:soluble lytic murein transglycosylase-like protein